MYPLMASAPPGHGQQMWARIKLLVDASVGRGGIECKCVEISHQAPTSSCVECSTPVGVIEGTTRASRSGQSPSPLVLNACRRHRRNHPPHAQPQRTRPQVLNACRRHRRNHPWQRCWWQCPRVLNACRRHRRNHGCCGRHQCRWARVLNACRRHRRNHLVGDHLLLQAELVLNACRRHRRIHNSDVSM
jgi:hypothetical protein